MINKHLCIECGEEVILARWSLGYRRCLPCGEERAKAVKHTVVPMNKSNYMMVTDMALLKLLNPKRTT